jgi:predicted Zn-dependent protease
LLLEQGEPHAASVHANRAIELDRELADAWLLKGRCDMAAGQHSRAVASLHRAANADSDCREAFLELAACWSATGEPLRALSALDLHNSRFAADQVPLRAVELTGRVLLDLGQHNRASRVLAEATRRPESSRGVWVMLVEACHAGGDIVGAQQAARSAQQLYPEDPEISGLVAAMNPPADNRMQVAR